MLEYTGSTIAASNSVMTATGAQRLSIWGMTFVEGSRFMLVLAKRSDGVMVWRKVDTLAVSTISYAMPYEPVAAGIAITDRGDVQGQFLTSDENYLYYLRGSELLRRNYDNGSSAGSHILRDGSDVALNGANIGAIAVSPDFIYVVSKVEQKVFAFSLAGFAWDGTSRQATSTAPEARLTDRLCGAYVQPSTLDLVLLIKGSDNIAVKYAAGLTLRKGSTVWTDPSTNIIAAQYRGSTVHVLASDNLQAGTGFHIFRFADASTGVIAQEKSMLSFSETRVKVGSGSIVRVTYRATDGYGEVLPNADFVLFTLLRVGDADDSNDGALALTALGPFRNSQGEPYNMSLEVPFNNNGEATCFWLAPETSPRTTMYHRIRAKVTPNPEVN